MVAFFAVMLAALLLASDAKAQEHQHGVDGIPDWYDPACCNKMDCRPVKDEEIEFSADQFGLYALHKPTGAKFYRDRFRQSQDERYHVCITQSGSALCFYDRTGA